MYIAHITELQNDVGHAVRKLMGRFTLADRCSSRPLVGQVERFSEISYERLKYAVSSLAPSVQCNECTADLIYGDTSARAPTTAASAHPRFSRETRREIFVGGDLRM